MLLLRRRHHKSLLEPLCIFSPEHWLNTQSAVLAVGAQLGPCVDLPNEPGQARVCGGITMRSHGGVHLKGILELKSVN